MKAFTDFVYALEVGLKNAQLYGAAHPRSVEAVTAACEACDALVAERERIQLVSARGKLFLDGEPLEPTPHMTQLVRQLDARKIGGFVMTRGVRRDELQQFIRILALRPDHIEAQGGASQLLLDADVTNIRPTRVRYEELLDGEEIVPASLSGLGPASGSAGTGLHPEEEVQTLVLNILGPLLRTGISVGSVSGTGAAIAAGQTEGSGEGIASTGDVGERRGEVAFAVGRPFAQEQFEEIEQKLAGVGAGNDIVQEAIRQTVGTLSTDEQWALLLSIPQIQNGPVREKIEASALEMMNRVLLGFVQRGIGAGEDMASLIDPMVSAVPQRDRALELVRSRLVESGISREQLDDLLEVLSWENLASETKLAKLLSGSAIFRVPQEKVLTFARHLLGSGRGNEALQIVESYSRGLNADSPELRLKVVSGFAHLAGWSAENLLTPEIEALLEKSLLNHFIRETEQGIQQRSSEALEALLGAMIQRGSVDRCYRNLIRLSGAISSSISKAPWKRASYEALLASLTRPQRFAALLSQIFERDAEVVAQQIHPLLAFLGEQVAGGLLDALATDVDRAHRARLVRAIKAVGRPALQHLHKAVYSPTWYVVRNAVTLLGDLVAVDLIDDIGAAIKHEDPRVRRAAARALGRLGGLAAEGMLLEALPVNDPETQVEILNAIGALRVAGAVPLLADYVRNKRASDDRVRERAIETLGHIGAESAVPVLAEVLRRRGLRGADQPEHRAAAARALMTLGTEEAKLIVKSAVEAEPRGAVRDLLEKAGRGPAAPIDLDSTLRRHAE